MKIIIIGCTHAGTAAAINTSKLYKDAQITVYERNDTISFLSCGIALYVGGVVKDVRGLFYSSPEQLRELGINTKMKHDVLDVDFDNKKIRVKNLETGEEFIDNYDKLIITTGSWPIIPKIEGYELQNILLSKNYYHANEIIKSVENIQNVVVIGAGYIGVELAEAFREKGKNVTLIDTQDRILSKYLDKEFTDLAEDALKKNGINLALSQTVVKFEGEDGKVKRVITDKGQYDADVVIVCVGFKPSTEMFKGKLDMLPNGAIIVDEYMRTSKRDVFAAGDCAAVWYNPTKSYEYIPLATNAVRMGTLAARNLVDNNIKWRGTQGTSGIKIYDLNIASTGLIEEVAKGKGLNVQTVTIEDNYRPEFMPTYEKAKLKVVFEKETGRIVGAQILSKHDLTSLMNIMSVFIQNEMTIEDLAFTDFFFQPHFNKPWNLLNLAGLSTL
ncbi:FAD-dependent oxidoreductase [Thermobrachium celere]|uniref:FAD-dependent oxidoreductase n=1 Tax=Thermobrachium celere TaxID=53422 RepID=UPI0019408CF3|nr:FAD-dependent oxidoreductase [Thermobrachium celere]GFR35715.1 NADH dehydrogenase [Thermobrachium celere]